MINRDDMLELTRRMTPKRNCFDRIAGAYINEMGEVDESFNIHFGKLSSSETAKNLEPAKPDFGFLYPAFSDRSGDIEKIDIFHANPEKLEEGLMYKLLGSDRKE